MRRRRGGGCDEEGGAQKDELMRQCHIPRWNMVERRLGPNIRLRSTICGNIEIALTLICISCVKRHGGESSQKRKMLMPLLYVYNMYQCLMYVFISWEDFRDL